LTPGLDASGRVRFVAADKAACCIDTPWTTASEAACQHPTTGTDSGDADGTGYTWTAGTGSRDATCGPPPPPPPPPPTCACELAGRGNMGSTVAAVGKPFYVSQPEPGYGYGCEAHDKGQSSRLMGADGNANASSIMHTTCSTDGLDADGEENDWCLDQWCIVPKGCSGYKLREVSYTADTDDWFSYEVCEGKKGVAFLDHESRLADPTGPTAGPLYWVQCLPGFYMSTHRLWATDGEVKGNTYECTADGSWATNPSGNNNPLVCTSLQCESFTDFVARTSQQASINSDPDSRMRPCERVSRYGNCVDSNSEFRGNGLIGRCECEDHDGSFCACPPKYSCSVSGVPTEAHECPCFCEGRGNDRKCQYVDVNGITRNGCASSAAAAAPLAAAVALALFWA
jgi:hypothetical protein